MEVRTLKTLDGDGREVHSELHVVGQRRTNHLEPRRVIPGVLIQSTEAVAILATRPLTRLHHQLHATPRVAIKREAALLANECGITSKPLLDDAFLATVALNTKEDRPSLWGCQCRASGATLMVFIFNLPASTAAMASSTLPLWQALTATTLTIASMCLTA